MITIQDLQDMLDDALDSGYVKPNSEVRYIDRDRNDCSLEPQWVSVGPGLTKSGVPADRRYGTGALFLAQEQKLRDAPDQLCLALDW